MYDRILEEIGKELEIHNEFLKMLENCADGCYSEEFQILLDYFADRLMILEDLIKKLKEVY